jgi:hypothetical protein
MRVDRGAYDPTILAALVACHDIDEAPGVPLDVDVADLQPGMVVFDDVLTTEGLLLISRGTVVTDPLILRLENYVRLERVDQRVRVSG